MERREVREKWGDWKVEIVNGERSVSRCWIVDRQLRIGRCPVKVGGIAGVGTERDYRNRGLARQVMEGAVELMKREGYDASFLFGIQDFYHKYGFLTCMAERRLYVDTRSAERAENKGHTRPMKKGDIPQIARLYNRDNACRTASVVRDPRKWQGFRMGAQFGVDAAVQVVVDDRNRVRGYVVYDQVEHRVRAAEVGGDGEVVFNAIDGVPDSGRPADGGETQRFTGSFTPARTPVSAAAGAHVVAGPLLTSLVSGYRGYSMSPSHCQ